jgi:alkylhydroperoxidase family enzyme
MPPAPGGALSPVARLTTALTARATHGEPLRIFATLGRHPRLFRSWLRFAATLMFRGELPRADRELITLRTAWRCGSWYEWVQHAALARRAGLGPRDIERIVDGAAVAGWRPRQRLLLQAADELHDRRAITDRTWQALRAELTDRQLIELCLLVGHYEMLAMTLNSLGVEPESSAVRQLTGAAAKAADHLRDQLVVTRRA